MKPFPKKKDQGKRSSRKNTPASPGEESPGKPSQQRIANAAFWKQEKIVIKRN